MVAKLKDVAKLAGVSVTTVSRVINNYGSLSKKTIYKVHQAMQELNYQPNALARAMQGKPSNFIGLIFPNLTNPFYAELVNELESRLFAKGYKTIIASAAENEQIEHEYLGMLMANQVDGIISGSHNLGIEEYKQVGAPIVSFDRYLAEGIPIVTSDSYSGGRLAADYLVNWGCQNLAVLIDEDTSSSPTINRVQGVVDYMNEHDFEYIPLDVNEIQVEEVFPGDFDGVLAPDDEFALQIRSLAERAGKVFGKDFIVTGYNGSHLVQKIAPDLPTVVRPVDSLADELIDTLLKRIADPTKPLPSKELPVRLTNPLPN
ncbi:LacI family DNA-binding transcriptional regulator [Limosilactobacillus ingluviei]|uniref:LacI family DNA-binding transcriptional regulator n=1 Tax=Limosilactobacillus ingluviei TaxID=148604 RepID=UPI0024BB00E2|nr:LacI family DNA-binding transcriptional regulator [Limosilactobacillus ingluviei]